MGHGAARRWTYDDLQRFPDDKVRREILDGELVVTPSPVPRHEAVVIRIATSLFNFVEPQGGQVFVSSLDVPFEPTNVVKPDVQLFLPEHVGRIGQKRVEGPPDLVAEVSSPSTKGWDRLKKRALYERFGVAEYWIVDLDEDVIEAYRLADGAYGAPVRFGRGDAVSTPLLPGWSAEVAWLLPTQD